MAPIAPKPSGAKRLTARQKTAARLADPLLPRKLHREDNVVSDSFINSKRDKRIIKKSSFISRVSKSSSKPTSSLKRRRPSKKLVTTLESLGAALADITDDIAAEDADKPAEGKVRHKSLRSRPGALKRKEKVVKGEMERFGRSLAQLTSVTEAPAKGADSSAMMDTAPVAGGEHTQNRAPAAPATANRWAALRGFISATMEQNPAFKA
ncbi:ribosome biogenesis protein SLX9-domain-containing protein [Podospora didyma]|uniref:Ribosome biogenesis protein SLX9 n=1 Tax=Podospora didyma TaxID=330526 RepID=A0AAE0P557_9PEZI|nr:ribosome biogenesis protein SLX9-domain-containing protein [Podospora didyma]